MTVPHTRSVPVLATASGPDLLHADEQQGPDGLLRVPGAALSTVEMAVSGSGIPAVGFYAQVPHYVGGPYAAAVQLGVSAAFIRHYLDGTAPVPDAVLLRAVDIVLEEFQRSPSGASQPFDRSPL